MARYAYEVTRYGYGADPYGCKEKLYAYKKVAPEVDGCATPHGSPSTSGEGEEERNSLRSYPSSLNNRYVSGIGSPTTLV